uniref:Uncharacterized protein n=1 Tax=Mucochytrium quahogii TaxID=96639 RepID=A0A7S2RKY0_9STRA|mmetsp:Transcript_13873/g.22645  ORF Transcript_13873/g.22645 Transcript_13873/m.22645 type:complete len:378 (+) Transcript_13873:69-1202(+)|eukprot:CAMPEP_0203760052 /NCGR_PEP_ID=MMETSP0098-20131031/13435_1 /ASSEMBLY_ACC=CAM_ASM_000208 /TAXON_ID=96639 /ORGANISM=" , Strain NY0313808BC1" /LENGTH=377 /DNA_ID=CAMNT_0050653479 /DNA_START=29 /DNA_END=1162 /DNA_ORIENTATION=-
MEAKEDVVASDAVSAKGGKRRPAKRKQSKRDRLMARKRLSPDAVEVRIRGIPKDTDRSDFSRTLTSLADPEKGVYGPFMYDQERRPYKDEANSDGLYVQAYGLFRNKDEFDNYSRLYNGKEIAPGFILQLEMTDASKRFKRGLQELDDIDPEIHRQVAPLSRKEMEARVEGKYEKITDLSKAVIEKYTTTSRRVEYHTGVELPKELCDEALEKLEKNAWPALSDRSGQNAENYLVLARKPSAKRAKPEYSGLLEVIEKFIKWIQPDFPCTHIAVTKNFLGSPHTDRSDVTFQYAIGLGEYDGGALVVEDDSDLMLLHAVDTKNKVAKVDGRCVHWVRKFTGRVRYSLIFYCTVPEFKTPLEKSIYPDFKPAGLGTSC